MKIYHYNFIYPELTAKQAILAKAMIRRNKICYYLRGTLLLIAAVVFISTFSDRISVFLYFRDPAVRAYNLIQLSTYADVEVYGLERRSFFERLVFGKRHPLPMHYIWKTEFTRDLDFYNLDGKDLGFVRGFPDITSVTITDSRNLDLGFLDAFDGLQRVNIENDSNRESGNAHHFLDNKRYLIYLRQPNSSFSSMEFLENKPYFKKLLINESVVENYKGLESVSQTLEILYLNGTTRSEGLAEILRGMPNLRFVSLDGHSASAIYATASAKNFEWIRAEGVIGSIELEKFGQIAGDELVLENCHVTGHPLPGVFDGLKTFYLFRCTGDYDIKKIRSEYPGLNIN